MSEIGKHVVVFPNVLPMKIKLEGREVKLLDDPPSTVVAVMMENPHKNPITLRLSTLQLKGII